MSPAGKSTRRLTKVKAQDKWASWSADGTRIAFTRETKGVDEVWIMSAAGKAFHRLVGNGWDPAWAPDGTRITYASDRDGNEDIYVSAVSGGPGINLTRADSSELDPAWSPDGAKIAFA